VDLPSTEAEVQGLIQSIESQIAAARAEISEEQLKFERWKVSFRNKKYIFPAIVFHFDFILLFFQLMRSTENAKFHS
jgi:hypothetical protein